MRIISYLTVSLLLWLPPLMAGPSVRQYPLDENLVHEVPVALDEGTTVFLFPSKINGIYARKVSLDLSDAADFTMTYQPGQFYFTINARREGVRDVVSVVMGKRVYQIRIRAEREKPVLTASFYQVARQGKAAAVSPDKLLSLLDKSKLYYQLRQHYPQDAEQIDHISPKNVLCYRDFTVTVQDVWRYEAEDTLVFRVLLKNLSDLPIDYLANEIAVRVGQRIYPAALVDAAGVMPPRSVVPVYFAISGSPEGGRNHLSVNNRWNILVPRKDKES
ncbi:MAG: hypothetical protein LBH01_03970 [Verrucomicrobiales bacterium]|jgi:hypothetical protein|nr:hypothetical protein [Verrucomicrobiales bacterium]